MTRSAPRSTIASFGLAALALVACGGAATPPPSAPTAAAPVPAPATAGTAASTSTSTAASTGASGADAPEISRSAGTAGGVVVLWPRISPRATASDPHVREVAERVQKRLASLVARAAPTATIDVRPEPERVCPRSGCTAASVGVALFAHGPSCAAVLLVSAPGQSPQRLVTWGGLVRLAGDSVPFRQPPEGQISVDDFASCTDFDAALAAHDAEVVDAIRAARSSGSH